MHFANKRIVVVERLGGKCYEVDDEPFEDDGEEVVIKEISKYF